MDVVTIVTEGSKKGGRTEFAVGFEVNTKELADKKADIEFVVDELFAEAKQAVVEHLEYLVKGQLSALDATRT